MCPQENFEYTTQSLCEDNQTIYSEQKSITTQSVKLEKVIDSAPILVKRMILASSWYDAFRKKEEYENREEDVSCESSSMNSDQFTHFLDYQQLFELQQYRIEDLSSQLDLVRNSMSEYHDLLDKLQNTTDQNKLLRKKIFRLEQRAAKTTPNNYKQDLKKRKDILLAKTQENERQVEKITALKLALVEAQTNRNDEYIERIRSYEETVVKLKMELADSKSKEDWRRLKRSTSLR